MQTERRQPVGLKFRCHAGRTGGKQLRDRHLEESYGVVVCFDEPIGIDIEHDDRLGCVLDECAIARLAVAQCPLALQPARHVAHAQHEVVLLARIGFADRDLGRELLAAGAPCLDEGGRQIDERIVDALGKRLERSDGRAQLRYEHRNVLTEDFRRHGAEHARGGRVAAQHGAGATDGDDRIAHHVENRVQNRGICRRVVGIVGAERTLAQNTPQAIPTRRAGKRCRDSASEAILRHAEPQMSKGSARSPKRSL